MLNLLAWLVLAWKEFFPTYKETRNRDLPEVGIKTAEEQCAQVVDEANVYALQATDVSKSCVIGRGENEIRDWRTKNMPLLELKAWDRKPGMIDSPSDLSPAQSGGKPGFDSSIKQLVIEASWHAVSDEPDKAQFYRSHRGLNSKRPIVQEEDILPLHKQVSATSSLADDVFSPEEASERGQVETRLFDTEAASFGAGYGESAFQVERSGFCGTERTTLIAGDSSRTNQSVRSVSVKVTDTGLKKLTNEREDEDLGNDSGCLSDFSQTPKHYKSSIQTTLHSPFGSQENLSVVSYALDVGAMGHRRLDSWDALKVDEHPMISKLPLASQRSDPERDVKMKVTVRPKSMDFSGGPLSPVQVSISPTKRSVVEVAVSPTVVRETKSSPQPEDRQPERRRSTPLDTFFGFAEDGEEVGVARVAEQAVASSGLAFQSPIKRGTHSDRDPSDLELMSAVSPKMERKPTFDSETYSKIEAFYGELNKGMDVGSPPAANFQDFDEIMRKRRLKVDVMDTAGNVFGTFGNREAKVTAAAPTRARQRWQLVRFAVLSGRYKKVT